MIDTTKVTDVEIEDVMLSDFPDFCDAYIASATYDGRDMTEEELEELNDDTDFVYKAVIWSWMSLMEYKLTGEKTDDCCIK